MLTGLLSSFCTHVLNKMVCISCFVIPILLFIWHRFIRPIVRKFWYADKEIAGNDTGAAVEHPDGTKSSEKNGCPFSFMTKTATPAPVNKDDNLVDQSTAAEDKKDL